MGIVNVFGSLGISVTEGKIWGCWAGKARPTPPLLPHSGDSQRAMFFAYPGAGRSAQKVNPIRRIVRMTTRICTNRPPFGNQRPNSESAGLGKI